jgi:uncharacterized protein (DUF1810 family)
MNGSKPMFEWFEETRRVARPRPGNASVVQRGARIQCLIPSGRRIIINYERDEKNPTAEQYPETTAAMEAATFLTSGRFSVQARNSFALSMSNGGRPDNLTANPFLRRKMDDPHNLQRFVDAQRPVYETARRELRQGRKQSHWMWFIFPQIQGLGSSQMARRFAISSRKEAEAYLAHPILAPRLRECSQIVADIEGQSVEDIFGYPDDMKFRSSITLFAQVAADNKVFERCLEKYFKGKPDPATLAALINR